MTSSREVIKKGSKSFALASLFLPPTVQKDVFVLYAWLRYCDDVIDAPGSSFQELKKLKIGLAEKTDEYQFSAIKKLITDKKLSIVYFDDFFIGLNMDLENKGYDLIEELELYCYRVAGVVGLMLCPLIGVNDPKAYKHAKALGLGMQLTNICRDVFEDALNNRVYLPRKMLSRNFSVQDLLKKPELGQQAVVELLSRAENYYQEGNQGLKYLPFRAAVAVGSASYIYRAIGHNILKGFPGSLKQRTVVGLIEKIKCVAQGFFVAIVSRFQRL